MSTVVVAPAEEPKEFLAAKIGDSWMRVIHLEDLDAGTKTLTSEDLSDDELTKADLADIYSQITGTPPKNWKTRKIVAESLAAKIVALPVYTPPSEVVLDEIEEEDPGPIEDQEKKKRSYKRSDDFIILVPDADAKVPRGAAVADLPLQAAIMVTALLELAAETASLKISRASLIERLQQMKDAGALTTVQTPKKLVQYYLSRLTRDDIVRVS